MAVRSDYDFRSVSQGFLAETGSLLVQGAMFGLGFLPSRHTPKRARDLETVVFVHGLAANRGSMFPLQGALAMDGHRRQLAISYPSTGSIEALALRLKRRIDTEVKGGEIDLVCHSMGGLVARFYLQQLDGARRVRRLVTLATPHLGTHMTAWMPVPLVRQMSVGSPFLEHLNALPAPEGVEVTSIGAGRDLIVLPADNARAPFGSYHRFEHVGHTSLLLSPAVLRVVRDALGQGV